ncbi:hypothetical protein N7454_005464 [Penicillium verhagenii]|nr:hypothetical protein N7454_005464 [Penicillium verhagenii]
MPPQESIRPDSNKRLKLLLPNPERSEEKNVDRRLERIKALAVSVIEFQRDLTRLHKDMLETIRVAHDKEHWVAVATERMTTTKYPGLGATPSVMPPLQEAANDTTMAIVEAFHKVEEAEDSMQNLLNEFHRFIIEADELLD